MAITPEDFDFVEALSTPELSELLLEEANGYLFYVQLYDGIAFPTSKFIGVWEAAGAFLRRSGFHLESFHPHLHPISVSSPEWDPPSKVVSFPKFKPQKPQRSVERGLDSCQLLLPL